MLLTSIPSPVLTLHHDSQVIGDNLTYDPRVDVVVPAAPPTVSISQLELDYNNDGSVDDVIGSPSTGQIHVINPGGYVGFGGVTVRARTVGQEYVAGDGYGGDGYGGDGYGGDGYGGDGYGGDGYGGDGYGGDGYGGFYQSVQSPWVPLTFSFESVLNYVTLQTTDLAVNEQPTPCEDFAICAASSTAIYLFNVPGDFEGTIIASADAKFDSNAPIDPAELNYDLWDYYNANRGYSVPGSASLLVEIPIVNDTADEFDESYLVDFTVTVNDLYGGSGGYGYPSTSRQFTNNRTTIIDDDLPPVITFSLSAFADSQNGYESQAQGAQERYGRAAIDAVFSNPSEKVVNVTYSTASGTATGIIGAFDATVPDQDFRSVSNQTQRLYGFSDYLYGYGPIDQIFIPLNDDNWFEGPENFSINFALTNATAANNSLAVTIFDDVDDTPRLIIPTNLQANEASNTLPISVTLSNRSIFDVTVQYAFVSDSRVTPPLAKPLEDYSSGQGTLIFIRSVNPVPISTLNNINDPLWPSKEPWWVDENLEVRFTNPVGAIFDPYGGDAYGGFDTSLGAWRTAITIQDEQAAPNLSIVTPMLNEGSAFVFPIELDNSFEEDVQIQYDIYWDFDNPSDWNWQLGNHCPFVIFPPEFTARGLPLSSGTISSSGAIDVPQASEPFSFPLTLSPTGNNFWGVKYFGNGLRDPARHVNVVLRVIHPELQNYAPYSFGEQVFQFPIVDDRTDPLQVGTPVATNLGLNEDGTNFGTVSYTLNHGWSYPQPITLSISGQASDEDLDISQSVSSNYWLMPGENQFDLTLRGVPDAYRDEPDETFVLDATVGPINLGPVSGIIYNDNSIYAPWERTHVPEGFPFQDKVSWTQVDFALNGSPLINSAPTRSEVIAAVNRIPGAAYYESSSEWGGNPYNRVAGSELTPSYFLAQGDIHSPITDNLGNSYLYTQNPPGIANVPSYIGPSANLYRLQNGIMLIPSTPQTRVHPDGIETFTYSIKSKIIRLGCDSIAKVVYIGSDHELNYSIIIPTPGAHTFRFPIHNALAVSNAQGFTVETVGNQSTFGAITYYVDPSLLDLVVDPLSFAAATSSFEVGEFHDTNIVDLPSQYTASALWAIDIQGSGSIVWEAQSAHLTGGGGDFNVIANAPSFRPLQVGDLASVYITVCDKDYVCVSATSNFLPVLPPKPFPRDDIFALSYAQASTTVTASSILNNDDLFGAAVNTTEVRLVEPPPSSNRGTIGVTAIPGPAVLGSLGTTGYFVYTRQPFVASPDNYPNKVGVLYTDYFPYYLTNIAGSGQTATIAIQVKNDAPVGVDDSIVIPRNNPAILDVLANDTDPDTDPLSVSIDPSGPGWISPSHGNITVSSDGKSIIYTPNPNYAGLDTFTYYAQDAILAQSNLVTVTVTVNDLLVIAPLTLLIPEDAGIGTIVGTVTASDPDGFGNPPSNWHIDSGNNDGIFNIDPSSGVISVIDDTNLDYETTRSYALTISVSDGFGTSTGTVTVTIQDVNDNPPVVTPGQSFSVSEFIAPAGTGTTVNNADIATVLATDVDTVGGPLRNWTIVSTQAVGLSGNVSTLTTPVFSFRSNDSGTLFVVNEVAIDAETVQRFQLTVTVDDDTFTSAPRVVQINVNNLNDNKPVVDANQIISIPENSLAGSLHGPVTASDADANDSLSSWQIVSPIIGSNNTDYSSAFTILPVTGMVNVVDAALLDYDNPNLPKFYTFDVTVSDAAGHVSSPRSVTIQLTDLNDEKPVIAVPIPNTFSIPESSPVGTLIHTLTASDADPPPQIFTWSIVSGNNLVPPVFAIDPATGKITIANTQHLDFEEQLNFPLQIVVADQANNVSLPATITVNISDVVEEPEIDMRYVGGANGGWLTSGVSTVNLGITDFNTPTGATFEIRNRGNTNLDVSNFVATGDYQVTPPGSLSIAPGTVATFVVTLDASTEGIQTGTLSFGNNDGLSDGLLENPFLINFTGEVNPENRPPVAVNIGDMVVPAPGTSGTFIGRLPMFDPDDDPLIFSQTNLLNLFYIDPTTGYVYVNDQEARSGSSSFSLSYSASDNFSPPHVTAGSVNIVFPAAFSDERAAFSTSHRSSLIIDPRPTVSSPTGGQLWVTVLDAFDNPVPQGGALDLTLGQIIVNANGTVTFTPYDNVLSTQAALFTRAPEFNGTLRSSRYQAMEPQNLKYQIIEGFGSNSQVIAQAPLNLLVTNDLPVFIGESRYRVEDDEIANLKTINKVPGYLDFYRDRDYFLDADDYFYDPDGDPLFVTGAAPTPSRWQVNWQIVAGDPSRVRFKINVGSTQFANPDFSQTTVNVSDGQLDATSTLVTVRMNFDAKVHNADELTDPSGNNSLFAFNTAGLNSTQIVDSSGGAIGSTDGWTLAASIDRGDLQGDLVQKVGPAFIDLVNGNPLLEHAIDFDQSSGTAGGNPLRGLIYDQRTVNPTPSITAVVHRGRELTFLPSDVDVINDTIRLGNHGLINNTIVTFTSSVDLPAPLTAGTSYRVIIDDIVLGTIRLRPIGSGPDIDLTSKGLGPHSLSITEPPLSSLRVTVGLRDTTRGGGASAAKEYFKTYDLTVPASLATANDYSFTVPLPTDLIETGVYQWSIHVLGTTTDPATGISNPNLVSMIARGDVPVVARQQVVVPDFENGLAPRNWTPPFGEGWQLEGVPQIWADRRSDDETRLQGSYNDMLLLWFPGEEPMTYRAPAISTQRYTYTGGTFTPYRTDIGAKDPRDWGTLKSLGVDGNNLETLEYVSADDVVYTFTELPAPSGITNLPLNIEEPSVWQVTSIQTRAGAKTEFIYETDIADADYRLLKQIKATDGSVTDFVYETLTATRGLFSVAQRVVDKILLPGFGTEGRREIDLTVNPSTFRLDRIVNTNQLPTAATGVVADDQIRKFIYSPNGMLELDEWRQPSTSLPVQEDRVRVTRYEYSTTDGMLTKVQAGEAGDANELEWSVNPVLRDGMLISTTSDVVAAHPLQATVEQSANLKAYDPANKAELPADGIWIDRFVIDSQGRKIRQTREFDPLIDLPTMVEDNQFAYDQLDNLVKSTDAIGRVSRYTYDYLVLPTRRLPGASSPAAWPEDLAGVGNDDASPQYDPSDYRGNLVRIDAPNGVTNFTYETDNERGVDPDEPRHTNVGLLISTTDVLGRLTTYEYDDDANTSIRGGEKGLRTKTVEHRYQGDQITTASYSPSTTDAKRWLLQSTVSPIGLITDIQLYDNLFRPKVILTNAPATGDIAAESMTAENFYDAFGNIDRIEHRNGGLVTGTEEFLFDATGLLVEASVLAPSSAEIQRRRLRYAADGQITQEERGDINQPGTGIVTEYDFSNSGQLKKVSVAPSSANSPVTYTDHATLQNLNVSQVTQYSYYSDGSIRMIDRPGDDDERFYARPSERKSWALQAHVAGHTNTFFNGDIVPTFVDQVIETVTDALGRVTESTDLLTGKGDGTNPVGSHKSYLYEDHRNDAVTKIKSQQNIGFENPNELKTVYAFEESFAYDRAGQITRHRDPVRPIIEKFATVSTFDELGFESVRFNTATRGEYILAMNDPVGNVTQQIVLNHQLDGSVRKEVSNYAFDAQQRLRRTVTNEGDKATVDYAFDTSKLLYRATNTDLQGLTTKSWADAVDQVLEEENYLGGITTREYDLAGNLVKIREPLPNGVVIDVNGQQKTLVERQTTMVRDAVGRVRQTTVVGLDSNGVAAGDSESNYVDYYLPQQHPQGYDLVSTDARGAATAYRFDALQQPVIVLHADPTNLAVMESLNQPRVVDIYAYDYIPEYGLKVVTTTTSSLTSEGTLGFNDERRTQRQIFASDDRLLFAGADLGQTGSGSPLTATSDLLQGYYAQTRLKYDSALNLKNQYDPQFTPEANGTAYSYNYALTGLDQPTSQIKQGTSLQFKYDSLGNLLKMVDAENNQTTREFDSAGRMIRESVRLPNSQMAKRQWDFNTLQTIFTDRNSVVHTTTIAPTDRTVTEQHGSNLTIKRWLGLDGSLDLITRDDQATGFGTGKSEIDFTYDQFARVVLEHRTFNLNGVVIPTTDLEYKYESGGLMESRDTTLVGVPQLNNAGNGNATISDKYAHDVAGRLVRATQVTSGAAPATATFRYNVDGQVAAIRRYAGMDSIGTVQVISAAGFREDGTRESLKHSWRSGANTNTIAEFSATLQTDGKLHELTTGFYNVDGSVLAKATTTFQYDQLGRLESASKSNSSGNHKGVLEIPESMSYDKSGNIQRAFQKYGGDNRLVENGTIFGYTHSFLQDFEGRLTENKETSKTPITDGESILEVTQKMTYTVLGELRSYLKTRLDNSNTNTLADVAFAYDPLGRLIARQETNHGTQVVATRGYVADDQNGTPIAELVLNGTPTLTQSYLNNPLDGLLLAVLYDADDPMWALSDLGGAVTSYIRQNNGAGLILHQPFDSYGIPLSSFGDSPSGFTGLPLIYGGGVRDVATGLTNIAGRQYSSELGRYIEQGGQAPTVANPNPYQYASGYPQVPKPTEQPSSNIGTRVLGGVQAVFGVVEIVGGTFYSYSTGGIGAILGGGILVYRGSDDAISGITTAITGEYFQTQTARGATQLAQAFNASAGTASSIGTGVEIASRLISPIAAVGLLSKVGRGISRVRVGNTATTGSRAAEAVSEIVVAPKGTHGTQLYSYFDGAIDTTRPFTTSSGRVYMTSRAPGEWLTNRGIGASLYRFAHTGRLRPYASADSFFTTGLINPAEWGLKPIFPRTANFWKRLGSQYHTRIGTSGFELASPGSNLLINQGIVSTARQVRQARLGLALESVSDILVIGGTGTGLFLGYAYFTRDEVIGGP